MHERHGFITFKGTPLTLLGSAAEIGEPAPHFTARARRPVAVHTRSDERQDRGDNSVPSLDTPVCAAQARRFNQEATALGDDVKVIVVSMDLPFAQSRFCSTEGIANLETVSDHRDASFGAAYGLLIKELRLLARAVLVIGKDGTLRYQQLVPEVAQEPDYGAAPGRHQERALAAGAAGPVSATTRISPRPTSWPSPSTPRPGTFPGQTARAIRSESQTRNPLLWATRSRVRELCRTTPSRASRIWMRTGRRPGEKIVAATDQAALAQPARRHRVVLRKLVLEPEGGGVDAGGERERGEAQRDRRDERRGRP